MLQPTLFGTKKLIICSDLVRVVMMVNHFKKYADEQCTYKTWTYDLLSIHTSPCCLHITERQWLQTSQNPEMFHPCAWGCETGGAAELGFLHFLDLLAVGEAPLHTCFTYNFKISLHFMNHSKFLQQDCSGNSTFLIYYAVSTWRSYYHFQDEFCLCRHGEGSRRLLFSGVISH